MHKHLPYSSLKFKGMMVFKHLAVMMKASRESTESDLSAARMGCLHKEII